LNALKHVAKASLSTS